MKKATSKLLAGVLSLSMILTNMAGFGTMASFAAEEPTANGASEETVEAAITSVSVSDETISADGGNVIVTVTGTALPDSFAYKLHYEYKGTYGTLDDWTTPASVAATGSATEKTFEIAIPANSTCNNATAYTVQVALSQWASYVSASSKIAVTGGTSGGDVNPPAEQTKTGVLNVRVVDQNGDPVKGLVFTLTPEEDYLDPFNLPATDANGRISSDLSQETGFTFSFSLVANDNYSYSGNDKLSLAYNSANWTNYIDKFNGQAYDGTEQTITVTKVIDKSVINFKVIGADGNLASGLEFELVGETEGGDTIYVDETDNMGTTSVDLLNDGDFLQDTYKLVLSSDSEYQLAIPVSIVLNRADGSTMGFSDQIDSVNGEEYTGLITLTLRNKSVITSIDKVTKTQISSDGENSSVTISGNNIAGGSTVYYRLKYTYDVDGVEKSAYTDPVEAKVTESRGKFTFTAKMPASADYHNAKTWTIEACGTEDGEYVAAPLTFPVVQAVEVDPIYVKYATDTYVENGKEIALRNTNTGVTVKYKVQDGMVSGVRMMVDTSYEFVTDGTDFYMEGIDVAFGYKVGVKSGATTVCRFANNAVTDEEIDTIWLRSYKDADPTIITVDPIPVLNEDGTPAEDGHLIDIYPDGGHPVTFETKDGVISGVTMVAGVQYKVCISWDEESWDSWEQSFAGHEATYYRMTANADSTQAYKYDTKNNKASDKVVKQLRVIGVDASKTLKIAATTTDEAAAADAKFALVSTEDESVRFDLDAADADGRISMDIEDMEMPAGTYKLVALDSETYNASGTLAVLEFDTELEDKAATLKTVDGEDYIGVINVAVEMKTVELDKVTASFTSAYCNGKVKVPSLKVYAGGELVASGLTKSDANFTVSAKASKTPGKYTVTVTGKGRYTGSLKATYTLKVKPTTVSSLKKSKKAFTVKAKKQSSSYVTGYQVRYSKSKSMKKAKTKTIGTKYTKTTKKITKLTAKKKYYVQVRTYKKINGKKYYSAWSKAKSVKTK